MVETIFRTRKAMLLLTKTTCFAVVTDSDVFNKNMILNYVSTYKTYKE